MQQQVTVPQRLVANLQGGLVVTEPLEGSHDPASQPVVAAMLIQDACSLLVAQDLHGCDIRPGRLEFAGDGRDLRLLGQQVPFLVTLYVASRPAVSGLSWLPGSCRLSASGAS